MCASASTSARTTTSYQAADAPVYIYVHMRVHVQDEYLYQSTDAPVYTYIHLYI